LRLYDYIASANCLKVRVLLGLLGRDVERVAIDIFAGDTLTPQFAALNPSRETPVLEVDGEGVLVQSNAILWYLAEGTQYLPDEPWERAQVLRWLMFEQEYVIPGIAAPRFWRMTDRVSAELVRARRELGQTALARIEDALGDRPFLTGDLSIADIAVYAYTHLARDAGLALERYPRITGWIRRLEATPRFVNDLLPYPSNASRGAGRSIYDPSEQ